LRYLLFILIILSFKICYSQQIVVINIDYVVNNNNDFKNFLESIKIDQIDHRKNFDKLDIDIKEKINEIDELKIILNKQELDNKINENENLLIQFNKKINRFNLHYDNQINDFKKLILDRLLILLQEYASENKIDLILNDKSYIIASNSIDISKIILEKLNNYRFDIKLVPY